MHELGHNLNLCHEGWSPSCRAPEVLFVTSDNGRLYKLDARDWGHVGQRRYEARPICPDDKIIATPSVQLYAYSNPAFQSAA